MKRKKGQLFAEPFMWILALVVGAMIFASGYYMITNLIKASEEASIADFINELKKEVDEVYYLDVESSKLFKIALPSKVTKVCFYDSQGTSIPNIGDPNIARYLQLYKNKNVFLLPIDAYQPNLAIHKIENIKPDGFQCFSNHKNIRLVSAGQYVSLTQPN